MKFWLLLSFILVVLLVAFVQAAHTEDALAPAVDLSGCVDINGRFTINTDSCKAALDQFANREIQKHTAQKDQAIAQLQEQLTRLRQDAQQLADAYQGCVASRAQIAAQLKLEEGKK
jgi:hypothetical protein